MDALFPMFIDILRCSILIRRSLASRERLLSSLLGRKGEVDGGLSGLIDSYETNERKQENPKFLHFLSLTPHISLSPLITSKSQILIIPLSLFLGNLYALLQNPRENGSR